jgi:hypothetical protein
MLKRLIRNRAIRLALSQLRARRSFKGHLPRDTVRVGFGTALSHAVLHGSLPLPAGPVEHIRAETFWSTSSISMNGNSSTNAFRVLRVGESLWKCAKMNDLVEVVRGNVKAP